MRAIGRTWLRALRELGDAFLEVLKAEISAFGADLSASRRQAIKALLLLLSALFLAGWATTLLSLALIAYLQLHLPAWLAVLSVAGLLIVIASVLFVYGRRVLAGVRGPGELFQSRLENHSEWLRSHLEPASGRRGDSGHEPE